jgi:hypothetical protein
METIDFDKTFSAPFVNKELIRYYAYHDRVHGQTLTNRMKPGPFFNSRCECANISHAIYTRDKRPNLKLKTQPKQLLSLSRKHPKSWPTAYYCLFLEHREGIIQHFFLIISIFLVS